jgi:hypothetical protein
MRFTVTRGLVALLLLSGAAAVPVSAATNHTNGKAKCTSTKPTSRHTLKTASAQPAITFGVTGGNLMPWNVTIDGDGTITGSGWNKPQNAHLTDPKNSLPALFKLADTEGFWSQAASTSCTGTLPDIVTQYIRINSSTGSKKVSVHGGCVANFSQLIAVLENAAGVSR